MSNIARAFDHGKAFIGFVTAFDPSRAATERFVLEMADNGADLIEIGMPFSDPIAEGAVIQAANARALAAGATVDGVFGLIADIRKQTDVPLVMLTYLNPVFRYGYERFCEKAASVGLDGLIIPDLPFEEQAEVAEVADKFGVDVISLVAPTSEARVAQIARNARGFLYAVSSMGVTGTRDAVHANLRSLVQSAKEAARVPVAVGFGIHAPGQAAEIARYADGVIVGSAIVKLCAEYGEAAAPRIGRYTREMKAAVSANGCASA